MMKKQYETPCACENSFEFCDGIALIFDPDQSGSQQLGKERDDEPDSNSFGGDSEWQNGLW